MLQTKVRFFHNLTDFYHVFCPVISYRKTTQKAATSARETLNEKTNGLEK